MRLIRRVIRMFGERTVFEDRQDAGRRLAGMLERYRDDAPVVLAMPRGGVPVGYEVARALNAPLDVIVARKLGAPDQPELAIGAVAPGGARVLNELLVQRLGIPDYYLERITEKETDEAERRLRYFRGGRPEPELQDRTAILVDDGLATGATARAAIRAVRERSPRRIVLAVPVCAAQSAEVIEPEVDALVCVERPGDLEAIGFWYRSFEQTPDEEVVRLLEAARLEGD